MSSKNRADAYAASLSTINRAEEQKAKTPGAKVQVTIYLPADLHERATRLLAREFLATGSRQPFSALVEDLLRAHLESQEPTS